MTRHSGRGRGEGGAPLEPKAPRESAVTLSQLMEISHANLMGNVHGGEIMKLIDSAAGIAAGRHAGGPTVTASLDEMSFLHPVLVGSVVFVHASVNDVGRTSMEVGVRVEAEDLVSGERTHTSSAYLVFVALDEQGRPGRCHRWSRRQSRSAAARPRPGSGASTAWPAPRRSAASGARAERAYLSDRPIRSA